MKQSTINHNPNPPRDYRPSSNMSLRGLIVGAIATAGIVLATAKGGLRDLMQTEDDLPVRTECVTYRGVRNTSDGERIFIFDEGISGRKGFLGDPSLSGKLKEEHQYRLDFKKFGGDYLADVKSCE